MGKQFTEEEVIDRIEEMRRRRPRFTDEHITMSHGSGGKASRQLVEGMIVPLLDNDALSALGDAAVLPVGEETLAVTTDSFVVSPVASDTRSLWPLAEALLAACGDALHCMRDATRGGLATVLNEIALASRLGVVVSEDRLPLRPQVVGACEILGIDPLYVANEGKLAAFAAPEAAGAALDALRAQPGGEDAAIVGEVGEEPEGRVLGRTTFGGHRIDMLVGDLLPRIC